MIENRRWLSVDQIHRNRKSICPILSWHRRLMKKCETRLNDMAMLSLSYPIVFGCMRWRSEVGDAVGGEKLAESNELTTIIGIEVADGKAKVFLNKRLELNKGIADLGLLF